MVDLGHWIYAELKNFVEKGIDHPIQLENINPSAAKLTWSKISYDLRGITNHHFDYLISPPDWFERYLEFEKIRDTAFKKMKMSEVSAKENADGGVQGGSKKEDGGASGGVGSKLAEGDTPGEVHTRVCDGIVMYDSVFNALLSRLAVSDLAVIERIVLCNMIFNALFGRLAVSEEADGGAPGGVHSSGPGEVQDPEVQDP